MGPEALSSSQTPEGTLRSQPWINRVLSVPHHPASLSTVYLDPGSGGCCTCHPPLPLLKGIACDPSLLLKDVQVANS